MINFSVNHSVATITLDNPGKRNSLHPDLISALLQKLEKLDADEEDIRVVVLTGAGNAFCAGLDLNYMQQLGADSKVGYMESAFKLFRSLYELHQPVIAAVNGPAVAGGFDLAAFCDIRICSPRATFAQAEIHLGITQIMFPVYKVLGLGNAKELALTGRAISADDAFRMGLVTSIHPADKLLDAAMSLAVEMAKRPRDALFETKRLGRELIDLNFEAAFQEMFSTIADRVRSAEHERALSAFWTSRQ